MEVGAIHKYNPTHRMTENYKKALRLITEGEYGDALLAFQSEAKESECFGLAQAQAGLLCMINGLADAAMAHAQTALSQFEQYGCPLPPLFVVAKRTVADALSNSERPLESLDHYLAAIDLADSLAAKDETYKDFLSLEKGVAFAHLAGICNLLERYRSAINYATAARPLLEKHPNPARSGLPVALENLAIAYHGNGRADLAELALDAARSIPELPAAISERIALTRIQLLNLPTSEARPLVEQAIATSESNQKWEQAGIRCGIGIRSALANNDTSWARSLLSDTDRISTHLASDSLWPARISFYRAEVLKRTGAASSEIAEILVKGAYDWCTRPGARGGLPDYQFLAGRMNDHFRFLARTYLDQNMPKEAFVAFESGRARALVAEMRNNLSHRLTSVCPFDQQGAISLGILEQIQEGLSSNEVIVCLASVPPMTACFVIGKNLFQHFEVPTDVTIAEAIRQIPKRLSKSEGGSAIPKPVFDLGCRIAALVGTRTIRALIPFMTFHLVPWRAVLRHAGLSWQQLHFGVRFSPTLDATDSVNLTACYSLGFGKADTIDLNEEAEAFSNLFGSQGHFYRDADVDPLKSALSSEGITFVSCHGILGNGSFGPEVWLELKGGRYGIPEFIPDSLRSSLVLLSVCDSGAYEIYEGDYPVGAAPTIVLRGSAYCACTRFPIRAAFARDFFPAFGQELLAGKTPEDALGDVSAKFHTSEENLWRDIACVELLVRGD